MAKRSKRSPDARAKSIRSSPDVERVVIRGSKFYVARIMADAGIPFAFVKEAGGNTVGDVSRQYIPRLTELLGEHSELEGRFAKSNPHLTPVSSRMMKRSGAFTPPYHITEWIERDRAHIALVDGDGRTVLEWWDEEVQEAADDGFLTLGRGRGALEKSAIEYAQHIGLLNE